MKKNLTVSVIIPAYNAEVTIARALDSVMAQTYLPAEVIVVNDGSSDNTSDVVEGYSSAIPLRLIEVPNGGPARARNTAIDAAIGDWLAFLDADDLWISKDKLALQISVAEEHPGATVIDTFAEIYWDEARTNINRYIKKDDALSLLMKKNIINATSSVLAKTETVKEVGGFDPSLRFGEDRLLWANLAKRGEVHTVENVCIFKENSETNLTAKGLANIDYREQLVKKLLALKPVSRSEERKLWLVNYEEFLRKALKNKRFDLYNLIAIRTYKKSGVQFLLSRYSLYFIASLLISKLK
ncbi:glycosyltransferase family 2 protein [Alteromonas confluentis]|uniref:Glycosyltransferase 2-like domain-containing protein n=1 Tax=Alteromonas confluentis TaxID=1656094 RepID=A0A1E7Z8R8_9ALTE|nr:glycosyltransferase family A protein [Alteromonas confluentis]OFC69928.1 hypothetical protein BFC18_15865 [Alteromonas confluentis]